MVKVFLVEDEVIIRHGIRDNIDWASHGFEFAGEAGDGEYAYPAVHPRKSRHSYTLMSRPSRHKVGAPLPCPPLCLARTWHEKCFRNS